MITNDRRFLPSTFRALAMLLLVVVPALTVPAVAGECNDGVDNDGDGKIDYASGCNPATQNCDLDCYSATDPSEDPCSDGSPFCESYCAAHPSTTVRCIGFDDDAMVRRFAFPVTHGRCLGTEPGTGDKCFGVFSDGGGTEGSTQAMRLEIPLGSAVYPPSGHPSTGGVTNAFIAPFRFDNSVQFGKGSDFWVRWDQRMSQSYLDHLVSKQLYINEGDEAYWPSCVPTTSAVPFACASSCTDMEIVVQEGGQNGGPNKVNFYHGCPGPDGNKGAAYNDSTTADGNPSCGNIRLQHVEGHGGEMCCYNGVQTDCVTLDGTWMRFWMHVVVGPDWTAADDRIQMFVKRSGDTSRILVFDTDISKGFGDTFAGKLSQCGACSGSPSTSCKQDSDCGGSGPCDLRYDCEPDTSGTGKYGKLWINEYTAQIIGTPDANEIAYTWYDNLLITTADPDSATQPNPPQTPQNLRAN